MSQCLYLEGTFLCSSISATVSQYNPPSGSSFQGPTPQEWQADPSAGTGGPLAPSQTDPSYVLPPKLADRHSLQSGFCLISSIFSRKPDLHDSYSSICDGGPVDGPNHHSHSREGTGSWQGSVYLLEKMYQQAWGTERVKCYIHIYG